jgi:ankyrin repeat protein
MSATTVGVLETTTTTTTTIDAPAVRGDATAVISINASESILQEAILEEEEENEDQEDQEELWRVARQRNAEKLLKASFENKVNEIDEILTSEESIINVAANTAEGVCALHACASSKTVNFLLKRGADVRVRKRNNDQPLHVQCYAKNLKAIQYLLEAGADVNSRGDCGNSPLHLAVSAAKISQISPPPTTTIDNENRFQTDESNMGRTEEEEVDEDEEEEEENDANAEDVENSDDARARIVMELISRGADVHAKNDNAQTPLLLLSNTRENASVAELLLKVQNRGQSAREEIREELARLKLHEAIALRGENLHTARMKREARKNKALAVKRAHEREVHGLKTKLDMMERKERERIEEEQEKERLRLEAKKAKAKAKKASKK